MTIDDLNPRAVWQYFKALNHIPRPSYHEEAVRQYVLDEAARLGLWAEQDEVGNILVRKPASVGYEQAKGVILQSHLDMVPQKNKDKVHDFTKDPIETVVEGDWLRANGTTLGADNGIGAAAALAVLADNSLQHGPLEALFTATEECGMDGAKGLRHDWLQGEILLNLDSEEEGELYIGCAGGVDMELSLPIVRQAATGRHAWQIRLSGLTGGHSGLNIIDQRGNANILLIRVLDALVSQYDVQLSEVSGGSLRNAIPREAQAVIVGDVELNVLSAYVDTLTATLKGELPAEDQQLQIVCEAVAMPETVMDRATVGKLFSAVLNCPNGVIRMSLSMPGLVETSHNLARLETNAQAVVLSGLVRSSHDDAKADVVRRMQLLIEGLGGQAQFDGDYPGWQPRPELDVVQVMLKTGTEIFGKKPQLKGIHAGLECGILGEHYPHWQMISFGPTITGAHSPDEQVYIPSVATFWQWLQATLKVLAV